MAFNTTLNALPDAAWRAYESELIDQYLHPDFNPASPPQVLQLLERDNIAPQHVEAVQKVNRYAAAAAAIFTIGQEVLEGQGRATVVKNIRQRSVVPGHTPYQRLMQDVGSSWRITARELDGNSNSPLQGYLYLFDQYSCQPFRARSGITSSHIIRGGDLESFEGYLEKVASVTSYEGDLQRRRDLFHTLTPVQVGRATVHLATLASATPPWPAVQVVLRQGRGAPTLRNKADGSPLWQNGNRPDYEVTPLLRCPAHRTNVRPGQPRHRGQTTYKNLLHASINEGFSRDIL